MRKHLQRHAPMVIMMIGIFIVSSDLGSADHTRPVLASIVRRFLPWLASRMDSHMIDITDFIIRKIAHVTEYAVLSLLVSRSLDVTHQSHITQRIICVGVTSLYALSDEVHQSFVPSRGATYIDVLWDTLGATLGTTLLSLVQRSRHRKQSND